MESALKGIEELREKVDTMVVIPNQRLLEIMDPGASFLDAMHKSDEVLLQAVKSIANLSTQTGLINVDFADVRSVMDNAGTAMMGLGSANGPDRAMKAAEAAIESPLLEVRIDGATGVLFNVVGGKNLGIQEIDDAAQLIRQRIAEDANFIFGAAIDQTMPEDEMSITVIATGFNEDDSQRITSMDPFKLRAARTVNGGAGPAPRQAEQAEPASGQEKNTFGMFGGGGSNNDSEGYSSDLEEQPSFLRKRAGE
jgi:cell division protein FtsZ